MSILLEYSPLFVILLMLLLSAFFSGIEMAYVASDKLQLEMDHRKGSFVGKLIGYITDKPSLFIATTLVGNTIALVVYGIFMAKLIEPWLLQYLPSSLVVVAQTIISTLVVLFTAEFLPKSLFLINPNNMLSIFALPFAIVYTVFYIPVAILVTFSKWVIVYLFKWEYEEDKPIMQLTDLSNFVQKLENISVENANDEEIITTIDKEILFNAINFKGVKIRDCLVPRNELVAIDMEDSIEELKAAFIKSGHSKVLIYKKSIDDIVGYCHSTKLFKKPEQIQDILSSIIIVPETAQANDVLVKFIDQHKSIALVVDEFGGTSGIVSLEDILEEILGEIHDEHDKESLLEEKLAPSLFMFSARQEIDHINETYGISLPDGEYETLGGLIITLYEDIPKVNQVIITERFEFTIISREQNKLDKIKVKVLV
ncbi:MAG: hemolysin family protein [Cyclobacteriaceae bacterium]